MKKLLCILLAVICLFAAGCSAGLNDGEEQGTPAEETAPPADVTPFEQIFGKDSLTIELLGSNDEFFEGAAAVADELGVETRKVSAASAEADGVLAYKPAGTAFESPACVYTDKDVAASENLAVMKYDGGSPAENIFESIVNYDGHETPVRVINLYSADGEGAAIADRLAGEGKLLIRRTFTEGGEETAEAFLAGVMERYYPGMVEAVYADTAELAIAAYNAFTAAGRTDFKVFSAEITPEIRALMAADDDVLCAAAGRTDYERGEIAMRLLLDKLAGGKSASEIDSSAVIYDKFIGEGDSAPAYYKAWMDELK